MPKATLETIQEDLGELRGDLGTLRGDLGTIQEDLGELRGDLGTLRGDLGTLRGDLGTLRGDLKRTKLELRKEIGACATKKELHEEIENLAQVIAKTMATKEELQLLRTDMQNGFALVMEELRPMRRDYQALREDLAPQIASHEIRIAKLEQSVSH